MHQSIFIVDDDRFGEFNEDGLAEAVHTEEDQA